MWVSVMSLFARTCFSRAYPATQADNPEGLTEPGMKGTPVGGWSAPGAKGCETNFVCVRSYPPEDGEPNTAYHPCLPDERPQGTDLEKAALLMQQRSRALLSQQSKQTEFEQR